MEWKYCKRLLEKEEVDRLEASLGIILPSKYKDIVRSCNGGRPDLNVYDLEKEKEKMIKGLLPIGEEFDNSLLKVKKFLEDSISDSVFPFANDPSGDYLCFKYDEESKDPTIVLWQHETNEVESVADSFETFLNKLYKL